MSYLLQLADELMTVPVHVLAEMYNESERKMDEADDERSKHYHKIMCLLDQAANKRLYERAGESGNWHYRR